ncbi:hypothetical protein [Microcoleus sp. OTE_8_concoct_300]|uniref:hypothetical protein n=1 Tax=Microcoleus sp. OTE_8_concoct_300 TaxID=2964710 RepID=UPI00403FB709
MKPCQLGYICELTAKINTNKWGEEICENREACEEWALSWGLPYTYSAEEKKLTVEFRPTRYYWLKVTTYRNDGNIFGADCKIDGMKFGLSMAASERMISEYGGDELDVREIIIRALSEEGWAEAVSIEMQPKISRDGIKAIKPTLLRMIGKFRKLIVEKLNRHQTHTKRIPNATQSQPNTAQTQPKHNVDTVDIL